MAKKTSIYLNPPIEAALKNADSISGRIGDVCDRYAEIVRRARIRAQFSDAELNAFRDCCNGHWFAPAAHIDGAVLANFEDALVDGLAQKWNIDTAATSAKLRALAYPDQVALAEDIEAFWRAVATAGPDGQD
jgi:hypothetical protein